MERSSQGPTNNRRIEPGRRKVLVIDDDLDLLETIAEVLEAEGFDVVKAQDGAQGLAATDRAMPNLILLDMKMPVMNGWEFARRFHERYGRRAPIVVVTAASDARKWADDIGAEGWLEKPFGVDALLRLVRLPPADESMPWPMDSCR